ncbi:VOC family protein [Pseudomonas sp. BN411]|uniref:VOC family protein n=1 Tax=Pseudomonas sp. BN411 TaxID=2567887 RepID=UPI002453E4AC|nr:VOC family protein [Pseudomonas sp. BN411]MDH4560741.1 glyoxalase [Pseudomonas sp. BN411]
MAGSAAIPCLRYRDAPAAITWLCNTFGFVEHLVVTEKDGSIAHAQLSLGTGMIMLGSVRNNDYGQLLRQPDENGGLGTQGIYLVVADVDAVHARALAAGATVVLPLKDEEYGGRGFTCRDPEGHLWSIGSYDPWA